MYKKFLKRILDFSLSLLAILVLSPFLLFFSAVIYAKLGSPIFFKQQRPGKNEHIFEILKFRTMTNQRTVAGKLLPDDIRLTPFGQFLRSTSVDELPELINILKGDMSIVGPRPLLVKYLPLYNEEQKQRHNVQPGLTGLAQVNGRNAITWEQKFQYDIEYVRDITFWGDCKIIWCTAIKVLRRKDISPQTSATMEEFRGT